MTVHNISLVAAATVSVRPFDQTEEVAVNGFLAGTRISTPFGERLVEDLLAGDLVLSAADQIISLRARRVSRRARIGMVCLAGQDRAGRLCVSPQQKVAHRDWRTDLLYGGPALVAARDLVDEFLVRRITRTQVTLYELDCGAACVIRANGREVHLANGPAALARVG